MDYTYKRLAVEDVELLKGLLKVFGDAFNEKRTYQDAVPGDPYLRLLLGRSTFIALAALGGDNGDEVVGGIAAYVLDKFEQDRREIYIYDLAVAEAHRRKGIATALIKKLQIIAKELKAYVIFVQADPEDAPAIKLYESFGKREDVYHFDIPVDKE